MAQLTPQTITTSGAAPSLAAATGGGDSYPADGKAWLMVFNGGGSPITVTVVSQAVAVPGLAPTAVTKAVAAGGTALFAPPDPSVFADANGLVQVTYTAVTSVTVGAFRRP